jgi:hypothetical protein
LSGLYYPKKGAAINEYEAMVELGLEGEIENSEKDSQ